MGEVGKAASVSDAAGLCGGGSISPDAGGVEEVSEGSSFTLHEDYDARGFYLYEIARSSWGEMFREQLAPIMPYDPRTRIEGALAKKGVIRRRVTSKLLEEMPRYPEAFVLHLHHARRIFTFETPSEDCLVRRVHIHKNFIQLAVKRLLLSTSMKASSPLES